MMSRSGPETQVPGIVEQKGPVITDPADRNNLPIPENPYSGEIFKNTAETEDNDRAFFIHSEGFG